ncbi:2-oxoacid:ferredoxin oxidoreductase subunit gamma [Candidatus Bathyarchaeota archaeon]|nr:MAG: 2-oxoacid:ferredoxin oxidoreductase subunit gamma [Candidatus Bathyarchaeota archaeon]RJS80921.1 MAG: 2-oxoacid:ferredoxin oxidoreductase subunit gamma [Candidatus Bathyarchaeota archaeon]RLI17852.1 MAG: 2-oxoacid:ferredoxin oxidoreductase subunit gamma [Candidatus Bathyarchaeota archaeon]
MKNRVEVRIAGYGGQGVVLAGQILGKAAVYDGKNALQTQSYGAEARGSAARSEVIISDGKINFPAVRKCDILVAMNHESLNKHLEALKENGILIVDSTYVKEIPETKAKVYKVPATETAQKTFGASLYANMVMLGALAKITNLVSVEALEKAIKESVPPKTVETNITALKKGLQF